MEQPAQPAPSGEPAIPFRKGNGSGSAPNYIAVARGSDLVVIRVVGEGNLLTAPGLGEFAERQRQAGFTRFIFDMERCRGLDSTFMGVMVGIHTALRDDVAVPAFRPADPGAASAGDAEAGVGNVSAVNVSPQLKSLLAMLGVDKFVKLRGSCDLSQLETTMLPEKNLAPEERLRLIKQAHETLVEIDKRNQAQFGEFLRQLSEEIAAPRLTP